MRCDGTSAAFETASARRDQSCNLFLLRVVQYLYGGCSETRREPGREREHVRGVRRGIVGPVFTTARLLTGGDRAEAEDLLQGAYERAYRHWARICRRSEPERYVRQILVNASVDRLRRLRRRPEVPLLSDLEAGAGSSAGAIEDRDLLL